MLSLKSDSQIAIQAINGAIKAPSLILDIVADCDVCYSNLNIKFVYWTRNASIITDTIARKAHHCTAERLFINKFSLCVISKKKKKIDGTKMRKAHLCLIYQYDFLFYLSFD